MKPVRCLFYIGRGRLVNRVIADYTWVWNMGQPFGLRLSHGEVWTADEWGFGVQLIREGNAERLSYHGDCWTSTMRDANNGTVVRPAAQVLTTPEHWIYQELMVPETRGEMPEGWNDGFVKPEWFPCGLYEYGIAYMQYEVDNNKGYAKRDIGKFFLVIRKIPYFNDPKRNVCTELEHNAEVCFGILPGPFRVIEPRGLWAMNWQIHHVPTKFLPTGEVIHDGYKMVKGWQRILKGT